MKKVESYKLRKYIKFDGIEIKAYEFHQYWNPISINDIDINKIVVSNNFPFGKQGFKYLVTEILEILNFYAYFVYK